MAKNTWSVVERWLEYNFVDNISNYVYLLKLARGTFIFDLIPVLLYLLIDLTSIILCDCWIKQGKTHQYEVKAFFLRLQYHYNFKEIIV